MLQIEQLTAWASVTTFCISLSTHSSEKLASDDQSAQFRCTQTSMSTFNRRPVSYMAMRIKLKSCKLI